MVHRERDLEKPGSACQQAGGQPVSGGATATEQLAKSEERFRLAFENSMAGTLFDDLEGKALEVNDAFCRILGVEREDLIGNDMEAFTHPDDRGKSGEARRRLITGEAGQVTYTKRYLRRDGQVIDVEVSKSPARDATGATVYFVASVRDVTRERALIAQLSHQAMHDQLTGLANRILFEDRLSQAYARAARSGDCNAVMLLDLDDFKVVNDTLGHRVGDELLIAVARRLEAVTRSSDTLCRLGGDEFLYLAEGLFSPAEVEEVAKRLLGVFTNPIPIAGVSREQRASVGIVVLDQTTKDSAALIHQADVAMYEAKRQGKGRCILYSSSIHRD